MGRRLENLEQFGIDVVLERRHGIRASILRGILYLLSFVYERLVQLRLYFYRKRILRERALGCLVISVGNLTVGGTGKTPIVEKFARALQAGGRRVAILSRGYKSVPRKRSWPDRLRRNIIEPPRIVSDGKRRALHVGAQFEGRCRARGQRSSEERSPCHRQMESRYASARRRLAISPSQTSVGYRAGGSTGAIWQ
jgi:Tetraacyldisaccharide-1-P 4'-kinase